MRNSLCPENRVRNNKNRKCRIDRKKFVASLAAVPAPLNAAVPAHADHPYAKSPVGWKVSGILMLQTGIPLSITTTNTSLANNAVLHPYNNGASAALGGSAVGGLNPSTSIPASFRSRFGNTGRNLPDVRGPGLRSLDFAVDKDVPIRGSLRPHIRGEAFNRTNTPGFNNPDTNLESPTFGAITSQFNQPRQIQVGLRLAF